MSGAVERGEEVGEGAVGAWGVAGCVEVHEEAADDGEHDGGKLGSAEAAHAVLERCEPVGGRGPPEAWPEWFAGGVVSYSDASKQQLLGVDAKLIEEHGAVSPQVAEAMADGALERFDADVACAVTGVAGPDGGTEEKPVGYVCFCALTANGEKLARDPVLPGNRTDVRERSVVLALHLVRYLLEGREPPR